MTAYFGMKLNGLVLFFAELFEIQRVGFYCTGKSKAFELIWGVILLKRAEGDVFMHKIKDLTSL